MSYIPRHLEEKLKFYLEQFPVVVLTGPRQSGKSTLLRHLYQGPGWEYINLDQRGVWERLKDDPDLFVKDISSHIIIDEAQKVPELFHSIKWAVDEGSPHKVILSGSANFQLLHQITETLAGRVGILELFPLSINERFARRNILEILDSISNSEELLHRLKKRPSLNDKGLFQHLLWGGYPRIALYRKDLWRLNWFENYRTTYIERDLRDLSQIADIGRFQRFYAMLAFQIGQMLNLSHLANEIGISIPTCLKYLQILESSYQYFLLTPFHVNIRKRLVKLPKVYIWDTGLGNFFLGNHSLKMLKGAVHFGQIFENAVIVELLKQSHLLPVKYHAYFWRTSNGAEIDLLLEKGNRIIPVEIKAGIQVAEHSIRGLQSFMDLKLKKKIPFGIVFYRGDRILRITEKILAVPVGYL